MFRMTRRWMLFVGMTALPVASPFLTIFVKEHPETYSQNTVILIFVLLLFIAAGVSYLNLIAPLWEVQPVVEGFLDKLGESLIELGQQDNLRPRLNILLVYRDKRWLFLRRYVRIVWSKEMKFEPDMHVRFPITKGVAGEVCCMKAPRLADIETHGHGSWGFSAKQATKFPQLTAIYSWPIYRLDRNGKPTSKIQGTVNFDAQVTGAFALITARKKEYDELMRDFADFASAILSLP